MNASFVHADLGIGSVLLCCFESVLSQSFCFRSVLLYRVSPVLLELGDSGGVTSGITILFCVCLFAFF